MANEQPAPDSNNQPAPAPQPDAAALAAATAAQVAADKAAADAAAQTPEAKAAAEKAAADAAKAAAAPEKYAAFNPPAGVTLDAPVIAAFEGVAKELGLPQDKAQALIDKVAPAMAAQSAAAVEQVKTTLLAAAKADKDIGGDKFDESVATAKLAINAYFTPDFAKFLNDTGLGNHPEMIRGLYKAGLPLKADGHVPAGKNPSIDEDARGFYPNSKMEK